MDSKIVTPPSSNRFINYDINIACICDRSIWGSLIKEQCVRAGFGDVKLLYQGLESLEPGHGFDLVFIDESVDENKSGSEIVDFLLKNDIILPTTAVVMVGTEAEDFVQNYDCPLMLVETISSQFTEKTLVKTVQRLSKAITLFKPSLTFIGTGKFDFAYKSLQTVPKENITKDIIQKYFKMTVNLAYAINDYSKVISICEKPNIGSQSWSLWPKLKANYELANWNACLDILDSDSFMSLPAGPMKLFWQIRVLLEQQKFEDAIEIVNGYPSSKMSTSVVRLVFLVYTLAGKYNDAREFIKRKIRLAPDNSYLSGELTIALCNIYFYEYWGSESADKASLIEELNTVFNAFKSKRVVKKFNIEVSLLNTFLSIISLETDPSQSDKIKGALTQIAKLNNSPVINCRIAHGWHTVEEDDKALNTLIDIDCYFDELSLGCQRLILGLIQSQVFNNTYKSEDERFNAYQTMAEQHLAGERYKLACKAYMRALTVKSDATTKVKLLGAMDLGGMSEFGGYKLLKL